MVVFALVYNIGKAKTEYNQSDPQPWLLTYLILCPGWHVLQQVDPIHHHTLLLLHRGLEY